MFLSCVEAVKVGTIIIGVVCKEYCYLLCICIVSIETVIKTLYLCKYLYDWDEK